MKKKNRRRTIINLILLFFLAAALFYVFGKDYQEILQSIRQVSVPDLLFLMGAGMIYQMLDAAVFYTMIHASLPSFRYRHAVTVTFLTVFGNVTTSGAGSIPMQSYYLYRHGMPVGAGVGAMMLEYVFHKTAVFLYAAAAILIQRRWLTQAVPELLRYVYPGFLICGLIIVALVLLCTWQKIGRLLARLLEKLPDTGKWSSRKKEWLKNLAVLYEESQKILRNPGCCQTLFLLNALKLTWLYLTPFWGIRILGISELSMGQTLILTAVMFLITGALPNVAGAGPIEFAFLMLFTPCIGRAQASAALILYRIPTYFFPFLVSAGVFLLVNRRMEQETL